MIHEARHQGVRDQACRRKAFVDDLLLHRFLHKVLAALANPLAAHVPVHEELRGNDVQPFAHVLADAHHRLAACGRGAAGVIGLVAVLDAVQVLGQLLAPRLALGCRGRRGLCVITLQRLELGLQVGFVLGQRVLEHLALLSVHRLCLGTKLPRLQPRQLEGDALDLGVLEADLAVATGQQFVLGGQLCQQRRGQLNYGILAQALEVLGLEGARIEHAGIVGHCPQPGIGGSSDCLGTNLARPCAGHTRVKCV